MGNPIDLTTIAAVKASGSIAGCNCSDSVIQEMITSVSQYWLNRTSLASLNYVQTYSESYDGNGNSVLGLDNQRIISVASVYINNIQIQQSLNPNQIGWYIDRNQRFIGIRGGNGWGGGYSYGSGSPGQGNYATFSRGGCGGVFARGQNNVAVTYTAGFIYPVPAQSQVVSGGTINLDLYNDVNRWYSGQSVRYALTGQLLTLVPADPLVGQYTIDQYGEYGFNAADNGANLFVAFTYQGTPPDVFSKVNKMVLTEMKRLGTLDQQQQNLDGGSRRYFSWDVSPDIEAVIQNYMRSARS